MNLKQGKLTFSPLITLPITLIVEVWRLAAKRGQGQYHRIGKDDFNTPASLML